MMAILFHIDEGPGSLAPLLQIHICLTIEHFLGFWRGLSAFPILVFHAVFISMALRAKKDVLVALYGTARVYGVMVGVGGMGE